MNEQLSGTGILACAGGAGALAGAPSPPITMQRLIPYRALPSQKRFRQSRSRFKALSGPVGTGKSQALCMEAIKLAYQNPGCLGLIGAPTLRMLRDSTLRQFLRICGDAGIPYDWNAADERLTFREGGSVLIFRSLDNPERLRGPNLAWFGVDELTYAEAAAWERLEARLRDPRAARLCGFAAFTPKGFDWVYEKFRANPVEGYELIEAAPQENIHILEHVPDYYERLRRSYDSLFYEQEALGKFVNVHQGRVYSAFDRAAHVREVSYDPRLPLRWAWDFNVGAMSSLVCQHHDEEVRVLDEIIVRTSSTPEVCEEFFARWGDRAEGLLIYGDASGASSHSVTGKSDYYMIRKFFERHLKKPVSLRVPRANPPVRDRVNAVNARLRNAAGAASLFVDPRCIELIKDLEQVGYKPGTSLIDKESNAARTHMSDALGYYIWYEFRPLAVIGEQARRLV